MAAASAVVTADGLSLAVNTASTASGLNVRFFLAAQDSRSDRKAAGSRNRESIRETLRPGHEKF